MKRILIATTAALGFVLMANGASAQLCEKLEVTPADGGYKYVGVRRPAANMPADTRDILIETKFDIAAARGDVAEGMVIEIRKCGEVLRYQVKVKKEGDFHVTEFPVPDNIKSLELRSCSAATKTCYHGTFDGNFEKGVTLSPRSATASAPAATLRGGYKF